MGRDKALLPFAGYKSLSEYQYQKLSSLFSEVHISAKEDKFDFDAKIIYDTTDKNSQLVGIVSIFETLDVEEVFILSVDTPFVDATVINTLMKEREGYDTIIAKTESGRQPLCGIYKRTVLPVGKENLAQDDHRLANLLNKVSNHFVFFEDESLFFNLNHPHEYEKAKARFNADRD